MKIVGGQITGCSRLRPAADADHYVQAGNSVALLQPAFANFGFTKQSLTKDCSQTEAANRVPMGSYAAVAVIERSRAS
jgi:hypothetical protein